MRKDINALFLDELKEMYDTEKQIYAALPNMIKAADSSKLKDAFTAHWKETKGHIQRLEGIFKTLKVAANAKSSKAIRGLIQEGADAIQEFEKSALRDAALIAKAQRIEHFEISCYGTLRAFAKELGHKEIAEILKGSEEEEAHADKKLTKLAEGGFLSVGINQKARRPAAPKTTSEVVKKEIKTTAKKAAKKTSAVAAKTKRVATKAKAKVTTKAKEITKSAKARVASANKTIKRTVKKKALAKA